MEKIMKGLSLDLLSHPGETLKEVLIANNMTQKELATKINVSENYIKQIINGEKDISTDIAIRLSKVFSLSASFWNDLQLEYSKAKIAIEIKNTK